MLIKPPLMTLQVKVRFCSIFFIVTNLRLFLTLTMNGLFLTLQEKLHFGRWDGPRENHPVHHVPFRNIPQGHPRPFPHHRPTLHHHQLGAGVPDVDRDERHRVPRQPNQQADDPAVRDGVQRRAGRPPAHRRGPGQLAIMLTAASPRLVLQSPMPCVELLLVYSVESRTYWGRRLTPPW